MEIVAFQSANFICPLRGIAMAIAGNTEKAPTCTGPECAFWKWENREKTTQTDKGHCGLIKE